MKKELALVEAFHKKFRVPVLAEPALIPKDRSDWRYTLMKGEVEEYKQGAEAEDLENTAKELADILFSVYGTIIEHGLQDKMEAIFEEVARSNMSKEWGEYRMVKGETYVPANVGQFLVEEKQ